MLIVKCTTKNELFIDFETPMPPTVQGHPQWLALREQLEAQGAVFRERKGSLLGLDTTATGWKKFLRNALPSQEFDFHSQIFEMLQSNSDKTQDERLEVNFHQKSFDTPERYWLFAFNQGDFLLYFLNRVNWYLGPRNKIIAPFPLHVDIETANTCNMDCPMCYRDMMKNVGQMNIELFQKAVDECAENHVFSLRLSWRGEALTHPQIKEMISYATKRIPNVSFLTNAFYLEEDIARWLVQCGVNYIAVSFDGIGEVYEKVRHPAKFEENRQRLRNLRSIREQSGSTKPQVRLCTIWPAISDAPQAYYDAMQPVSDYLVYNPYINYKGKLEIKPGFICQYPWERIMVAFDGNTQCCTGWDADDIILGNLKTASIKEMWNSKRMDEIREIHSQGRRMELESCARCRHGSAGDPNATIEEIIARCH